MRPEMTPKIDVNRAAPDSRLIKSMVMPAGAEGHTCPSPASSALLAVLGARGGARPWRSAHFAEPYLLIYDPRGTAALAAHECM
jgi:hypothetical protein